MIENPTTFQDQVLNVLEYIAQNTVPTKGGTITGDLTVNGNLTATSVTHTSDKKLKEDLKEVEPRDLTSLVPYDYLFKPDGKRHIGLIAQDVQKIIPEAVIEKDGILSIDYVVLLVFILAKLNQLENDYKNH